MDTKLFGRNQPGGMFSIVDREFFPGSIFWVGSAVSGASDSAGYGRNPDAPFATIDYAVGKCTASAGDVIFVLPGHTEDLATATACAVDVAGVSIIGLGSGRLMPTLSTTAAAGCVAISAANVTIKNIKLLANFATGTTNMMTLSTAADGCTLDGLKFRDTSATNEALVHIAVATTVTDLVIRGCSFVTAAGSMTGSVVFAGSSTDCVIEDSVWYVDSSDSVIDHQTTAAVNILLRRNAVVNVDDGAAGYCVELKTGSTGIAQDNRFGYGKVDAEVAVGDAVWWFENYASNTIAESGLLDPSTSHAIP